MINYNLHRSVIIRNYVLIISLFLMSCHGISENSAKLDTPISQPINESEPIKSLSDLKVLLLDARNEKAELLLGKPDVRGKILTGHFYYMIYFNKVKDGYTIKHLVLLIDGKNGINDRSPMYGVFAVNDGEVLEKAGNFAQWLKVSRTEVKSNSIDFAYGNGKLTWSDINSGVGKKIHNKSDENITSVDDLPIPSQAISAGAAKSYIVTGVSGRDVYLWYANKYHAVLQSNEDSEHKYLYMPFNTNDSCILLTMTGHIDGSIKLEFSFQCDGGD